MRLRPLIPHRQVEHHTWEQSTLCDTEEEPRSQESRIVLRHSHKCGDDAPHQHESWEPYLWSGALEDYIARDFKEDLLVISLSSQLAYERENKLT